MATRAAALPVSETLMGCLLERPGQPISRTEIEKRLWPDGTYLDYERGVRVALKKLRDVLGDDGRRRVWGAFISGSGWIKKPSTSSS